MKITCEKCLTTYNVDPAKIGAGAPRMRCARCQHVWVHKAGEGEEVVSPAAGNLPHVMPRGEDSHHDEMPQAIPASVRPYTQAPLPAVDAHVMGLAAGQFGIFSFLCLLFVTMIALFLFRVPVTHAFPVMGGLYHAIGLHVPVPGEGLQFSEVRAQRKAGKLEVSAKLTNISPAGVSYPAVRVSLLGVYGAVLKDWVFTPEHAVLQAGESIPLSLAFGDAPKEGRTIEIKIAAH